MTKQKKSFPNLKTTRAIAMYPIITKKTTAEASSWYGATIIRTPTMATTPASADTSKSPNRKPPPDIANYNSQMTYDERWPGSSKRLPATFA